MIKGIFVCILIVCIFVMIVGSKKVRLTKLCFEQFKVFRNAKNNKTSFWDIICFIVSPIVSSLLIVYYFNFLIDIELAQLLSTLFSIVFTVLFGFVSILVAKINSERSLEKKVAEETFISIITTTTIALVDTILSIILSTDQSFEIKRIVSVIVICLSFITIMLLLLIIKRTFLLFINNGKKIETK